MKVQTKKENLQAANTPRANPLVVVIFILVGLVMSLTIKSFATQDIQPLRSFVDLRTINNQENNVDNLKVRNQELSERLRQQQAQLSVYQAAASESETEVDPVEQLATYLDAESKKYAVTAGSTSVSGPGIKITLADSEQEIGQGEDPNKYLVHNSDILAILNELRAAGAESIAINGYRVTSRSTIDCGGAVINVDGQISSHPFVIEAIGDPEAMYIYLNSDESIIRLLKYWQIKVNIEKSEFLELLASPLAAK